MTGTATGSVHHIVVKRLWWCRSAHALLLVRVHSSLTHAQAYMQHMAVSHGWILCELKAVQMASTTYLPYGMFAKQWTVQAGLQQTPQTSRNQKV